MKEEEIKQIQKIIKQIKIPKVDINHIYNTIKKQQFMKYLDISLIKNTIRNIEKQILQTNQANLDLKDLIITMIDIGWYPDIEYLSNITFEETKNMKEYLHKKSRQVIDNELVIYYQNIIDKIEEKLTKEFPLRAHIINEAFKAHKKGNYIVSIPLFLIQVDGIIYDTLGENFFIKKKGTNISKVSDIISNINFIGIELAFLSPFQYKQPIMYSIKERDKNFNHLNRHQILHGESINYHTKINSYKALSLIYYIFQAIQIIRNNK